MSVSFEEIRKNYPHPTEKFAAYDYDDYYCVGGALCLSLGGIARFPGTTTLADWLVEANNVLSEEAAIYYARRIIGNNDAGNFNIAWLYLREALEFGLDTQ